MQRNSTAASSRSALFRPRPRLAQLAVVLLFVLFPFSAFASEGNVAMRFTSQDRLFLIAGLVLGLVAIIFGVFIRIQVMAYSPGSAKMQEVGKAIREGAIAYLQQQIRTMVWFVVAIAIGLFFLFRAEYGPSLAVGIAVAFIYGVVSSYAAGYSGMLMAVDGNMRTAHAALTSYKRSLEAAFRSGSVTGLMTVGLGLFGASVIFLVGGSNAVKLLVGFGFGGSLAALFMRVGGGIFTKAADVGADLVGKVEAGIPEDDPRNPATIADNVGDNVGDCAGMAADVFESYSVTLVAAIILGAATSQLFDERTWMRLVIFALMVCAVGIIASIVGIFSVKGSDDIEVDPLKRIRGGFYGAAGVAVVGVGILSFLLLGGRGGESAITAKHFVSLERLQSDEVKKVVLIRDSIAKASGKQPYELSADDLKGDARTIKLGLSPEELNVVCQEAVAYHEDDEPKIPDFSNYKPIDFNDKSNPVLQYAVELPPKQRGEPPINKTLSDGYGVSDGKGGLVQKPLGIFTITVETLAAAGRGQQTPPPQTVTLGPYDTAELLKQIKEANAGGAVRATIKDQKTAILYSDADGRIAIAVDGEIEPNTIKLQSLTYYKTSVDEVVKAKATAGSQPVPKLPAQYPAGFGVLVPHSVPWFLFFLPVILGIVLAFAIEQLTDYYVSTHRKPTQEVAGVASTGPAPMIIQGFSIALESSVFMTLAIVIALMVPLWLFPPSNFGGSYILSFYGVALVGLGLLTTTGFILAMDTFGPISDNAQGVFEMSGDGEGNDYGSKAVARLDAAGNTTKALTKGFAIATAVIAAVALFHSYLEGAHLGQIGLRLDYPEIFLGLLIGGAAPFLFSAFSINAVGRAAFQLINEVRRQFRNDPGIMEGTSKPNYAACVAIVTAAAQKELLAPGILAITLPIAVGFGFSIGKPAVEIGHNFYNLAGAEALGGFLAGAILSGQLMAVLLSNAGGIWDNAKKIIEDGLHGGKGTEAHKASVVCDTVGDPFKDTAGPALNPLIKVMNLVALLLAPTIILPLGDKTLSVITGLCLVALVGSLVAAKKGSLSSELASATLEAHNLEEHPPMPMATQKRKITVDDSSDSVE